MNPRLSAQATTRDKVTAFSCVKLGVVKRWPFCRYSGAGDSCSGIHLLHTLRQPIHSWTMSQTLRCERLNSSPNCFSGTRLSSRYIESMSLSNGSDAVPNIHQITCNVWRISALVGWTPSHLHHTQS